jgi:hypothetical protein
LLAGRTRHSALRRADPYVHHPTDEFRRGFYESTSQTSNIRFPIATPFFEITATPGGAINAQNPGSRDYEMDLGTGVFLEANTFYFLSVRNVTPGRNFWQWQGDSGGFYISRDTAGNDFLAQLSLFFTLEGERGAAHPSPSRDRPPPPCSGSA